MPTGHQPQAHGSGDVTISDRDCSAPLDIVLSAMPLRTTRRARHRMHCTLDSPRERGGSPPCVPSVYSWAVSQSVSEKLAHETWNETGILAGIAERRAQRSDKTQTQTDFLAATTRSLPGQSPQLSQPSHPGVAYPSLPLSLSRSPPTYLSFQSSFCIASQQQLVRRPAHSLFTLLFFLSRC